MNKLYRYGLRSRPLDFNTCPKGFAEFYQEYRNKEKRVRYGMICYTRKLTDSEVRSYELVDLNDDNKIKGATE